MLQRMAILIVTMVGPTSALAGGPAVDRYDVVVYGDSSAGVVAAVQAGRMGKQVVLIAPIGKIGGMTTNGLSATDRGSVLTVGGIALELYRALYVHYLDPASWRQETRDEYLPKHPWIVTESLEAHWFFEPHVMERLLRERLDEAGVTILARERLDREDGVERDGSRIAAIVLEGGRRVEGAMFIDATYEGDLMAAAGVSYVVGREPNSQYDEEINGIRPMDAVEGVDPFVVPGDPSSGTLPGVVFDRPPGEQGEGDGLTQAYNFRLCLTDVEENQVPVTRPENYDPQLYELLARRIEATRPTEVDRVFLRLTPMPNRKTDTNNSGPFSSDFVGMSYEWPEADDAIRERIWQAHKDYTLGLIWFLGNDPRVPQEVRDEMRRWGPARDEFADTDHWPPQLYVREARRMVGDYVMTDRDARQLRRADDVVALATYPMDSHQVARFVGPEGRLHLEGGAMMSLKAPMPISYRSIVPRRGETSNLLVPVCVSSSHAAYSTIRMEPVYMMLGQSAATAACLAIDQGLAVQDLPYPALREWLLADGQILERPGTPANY